MLVAIEELYAIFLQHPTICTDSRKIEHDSIFFALKGDNFDGNDYAAQAIAEGSAYAVIDTAGIAEGRQYLLVEDVQETLQQLAIHHRDQLDIPIVCITGTNGKTTTKELLAAVLSKKYNVVATKGNLNNHLGVPLSLLTIGLDTEIAVIELGANHIGEIAFLCKIAKPTHGLITNIGKAHLEGFGDLEGVKRAKGELFQYLKKVKGYGFVNGDNALVRELSSEMNAVRYGTSEDFDCMGTLVGTDKYLKVSCRLDIDNPTDTIEINSQLVGAYNFENILAAVCVGSFFGVQELQIKEAIEDYRSDNRRSQEINTDRNHVIMDAYNANPMNMRAALDNFSSQIGENCMVILGDMLELGTYTEEEHEAVIQYLQTQSFDRVILVGPAFGRFHEMLPCEHYEDVHDAKIGLESSPPGGMNILVKGSRGIGLEALLEAL